MTAPADAPGSTVSRVGGARVRFVAGRSLLAVGLFAYFFALRSYSGYDIGTEWVDADLGQRAAQAIRVMNGELPYRDFWAPYPPMPYFLNAALFRVFGVRLSSFRLALAVVGVAGAFCAYGLTRRVASRTAALAACVLCASWSVVSLNVNYGTWYCVPIAVAAAWAAVWGVQSGARAPWFVAGLCAGGVLVLKVTYGMYVICAVGVCALAVRGRHDRGMARGAGTLLLVSAAAASLELISLHHRPTISTLLHFGLPLGGCAGWAWATARYVDGGTAAWPRLNLIALGVTMLFAPWIVYFGVRWEILPFLRSVFIGYAEMGASVVLPPARPNARALVLGAGVVVAGLAQVRLRRCQPRTATAAAIAMVVLFFVTLALPTADPGRLDQWLVTLVRSWVHVRNLTAVVCVWTALALLWHRRAHAQTEAPFFALTVCTAAILLTYYPYADVNHFQWAWPAQAALLCVLWDRWIRWCGRAAIPLWAIPFGLAAVQWFALATHFVRPEVEDGPWRARTFHYAAPPRGDVLVPAARAAVVTDAVALIRNTTARNAPVLELYGHCLGFLAERRNPTRYDYFWPGFLSETDQRRTIERLRVDPPPYIIGNKRNAQDEPLERFTGYFPLLGTYIKDTYRPYRLIGPYQFYARRPAAA